MVRSTSPALNFQASPSKSCPSLSPRSSVLLTKSPRSPPRSCPLIASSSCPSSALAKLLGYAGGGAAAETNNDVRSIGTKRMTTIAAVIILLAFLFKKASKSSRTQAMEIVSVIVGGLLSSSCCTIQLILNSVSVSCAGFAVLDRFRPLFLLVTFSSLAYKTYIYDYRVHKKIFRSLPTWILAITLASSPSTVRFINRYGNLAPTRQGGGPLAYKVQGMKCEACANGLKTAIESISATNSIHANVLFDEGLLLVEGDKREEVEAGVVEVMRARGYTAEAIEKVSPVSSSSSSSSSQQVHQSRAAGNNIDDVDNNVQAEALSLQ